jgi:uncharacterized membrane protein
MGRPKSSKRAWRKLTVFSVPFQMIFCALTRHDGALSGLSRHGSQAV